MKKRKKGLHLHSDVLPSLGVDKGLREAEIKEVNDVLFLGTESNGEIFALQIAMHVVRQIVELLQPGDELQRNLADGPHGETPPVLFKQLLQILPQELHGNAIVAAGSPPPVHLGESLGVP